MAEQSDFTGTPQTPANGTDERVQLANELYREFHIRCFWHSPRELVITEELIPYVVKGLRTYGGHRGFHLAARLKPRGESSQLEKA